MRGMPEPHPAAAGGVGGRRRDPAWTAAGAAAAAQAPGRPLGWRWYKGNTHTHTLESDGDSTPDEVTRWYHERGYHFLVLSDHNVLTQVDALSRQFGSRSSFCWCPARK